MDAVWIRQQLEHAGVSQAALGAAVGLTPVQINKILTGYRRLYADEADKIRQFFGYTAPEDAAEERDGEPDHLLPVYDITASAGHGALNGYEAVAYSMAFPPDYLQKLTKSNPRNLVIISVKGDSMVPTLMDDDVVMIDITKKNVDFDGLFVFRFGEALHVKRVTRGRTPATVIAISDNRSLYDPIEYQADEIDVVGRVIWYGRKV